MVSETYYSRYGFWILLTLYARYYNVDQITLTKKQRFQPEINVESTLTCYMDRTGRLMDCNFLTRTLYNDVY